MELQSIFNRARREKVRKLQVHNCHLCVTDVLVLNVTYVFVLYPLAFFVFRLSSQNCLNV